MLDGWLYWVLGAFFVLHESRPIGFTVGAIPLSEIVAYCAIHQVDDAERFCGLIRGLDRVFLAWQKNQKPKK